MHQVKDEDLSAFLKELRNDVRHLQNNLPDGKKESILHFKSMHPDSKFVSFEDEEFLGKECNQIMVNSYTGLTLADIDKAQKYFD